MAKSTWKCADCGGKNIHHDATVVWNDDKGDYDIVDIKEGMECIDCDDGGDPYYVPHAAPQGAGASMFAMQGGV